MASAKEVQARFNLINEAEAALALRYAQEGSGDIVAAVARVVSERVAPYNTAEYLAGRGETPAVVEPPAEPDASEPEPEPAGEPDPEPPAEPDDEPRKRGRA